MSVLLNPENWAALLALLTMEIVLGIDNIVFISIITNKLPEAQRPLARNIGIGLALILRLVLLSMVSWVVGLTEPVIDLGISGSPGEHGEPSFETAFSWRDIILLVGGIFLVWKATTEIHHKLNVQHGETEEQISPKRKGFYAILFQIVLLDAVFSIDSILTAVGMTTHLPIMVVAVLISMAVMLFSVGSVSDFIKKNPTVVMLALSFLLMIGMLLIADGFGRHVPKGYMYAAMTFSVFVEWLNLVRRKRAARLRATGA